MSDKMLRIAGRDYDTGLAKPINTDNKGNVNVKIIGESIEDSTQATITFTKDNQGFPVLRMVNVGHVGYDEFNDVYKVEDKSSAKLLIDRKVNLAEQSQFGIGQNVTIYSTTEITPLDISGKKELFLIVKNNQNQPIYLYIYFFKDNKTKYVVTDFESNAIDLIRPENTSYFEIYSNSVMRFSAADFPQLSAPYPAIGIRVRRTVVPTQGDVAVMMFGR